MFPSGLHATPVGLPMFSSTSRLGVHVVMKETSLVTLRNDTAVVPVKHYLVSIGELRTVHWKLQHVIPLLIVDEQLTVFLLQDCHETTFRSCQSRHRPIVFPSISGHFNGVYCHGNTAWIKTRSQLHEEDRQWDNSCISSIVYTYITGMKVVFVSKAYLC